MQLLELKKILKQLLIQNQKKQRLNKKRVELQKKNERLSDFQDTLKDPKVVKQTGEFKKVIPEAMGGYRSGGRAVLRGGGICKKRYEQKS